MKTLEILILENEDWLVDRVVSYAVDLGFAAYTSTLREAWRASICGLSGPILEAIAAAEPASPDGGGCGFNQEKAIAFGVTQAMRHRARGLRLTDFLGLLKYYRRAYMDLIDENPLPSEDARRLRGCLLEFFDQVEIGLCREWTAATEEDRLRDLQQKNKSLTNEKNKYLTIFESIREPVIVLDAADNPTHLNHAAHRFFVGDVAPGATYYGALKSPLLNSQIAAILDRAGKHGRDGTIETLSGPREFDINIQKMLDISRKFDGTVIILNDVSEYKRALRRAEAADHAKSTFLAAMSHEIRTPIAGVLGLARLLRDTELSGEQRHHVDGIISSGELLAGVVGDILDFSQAEVGGHPPAPVDFDLAALVHQVFMVVGRLAAEKNLALCTEIDPALPARLCGDTSMIRQVLVNLAHNAVKFTEEGTIRLRVARSEDGGEDETRVRFELSDTGIGLPDGPTDWLFDPFTQNDRRGDSLKGGVGLGLAICRKIVDVMGGEIGCQPNPGGGSLFWADLPLGEAQPDSQEATPVPARRSSGAGARVLVVDDDDVNRAVAEGFLVKLGHRPHTVSTASEALRLLKIEKFDIVLSDNRMPGTSGLELLERIRALRSGSNAGIPVIIVTASVGDVKMNLPASVQPEGILAKPYDTEMLARILSEHLPDDAGNTAWADEPSPHPADPTPMDAMPTDDATEDLSTLRQHMEHLGPERGRRVLQAFMDTAPDRFDALRRGVAEDDRQAVSAAAHALAGASGLLGLATMSRWAADIEARADDPGGVVGADDIARMELRLKAIPKMLSSVLAPT